MKNSEQKLEKLIDNLIILVVFSIVLYFLFSFAFAEFNISLWDEYARRLYSCLVAIFILIYTIIEDSK